MPAFDDHAMLTELLPVVEKELDRHYAAAEEWFPHQYVPWSEGRNYDGPFGGSPWAQEQSPLPPVVRTSLLVNLLTEDNLPSYHRELSARLGRDSAWGAWLHRWTAEEARHSVVIQDYLIVTRALDPVALERARMRAVSTGFASEAQGVLGALCYTTLQELATRIAHRNTGRLSGDPRCDRILARVARDENLHMVFYRNLLRAAFELAPDTAMRRLYETVRGFRMPGTAIGGFQRKALDIAEAGIYDLRIHLDEIVLPTLRRLGALECGDLGPEGRADQERLCELLERMDGFARRFEERRAGRNAALPAKARQR
ncbi:acyl-ACP desaturase [Actinomadura rubrisoli]|uniref:Acyl-ACP desaturase n=1 Tax=Actinomadura rubrisoli TaxID=2530368 RepID=A0A4R5CDL7_9ACTN|nr:acyl-ACP desaturase [Actinomadura rubrisoli]TDD98138.1 acyl-ACP desaturase [Actinomadura rubrisoli]